jgi:subtilisin family serine protease
VSFAPHVGIVEACVVPDAVRSADNIQVGMIDVDAAVEDGDVDRNGTPSIARAGAASVRAGALGHGSGTSFASPLVAGTAALCIYSGPCAGLSPAQIVRKMVADASAYNTDNKNSGYGFQGDPLRPISGKYYGYLIRAGQY